MEQYKLKGFLPVVLILFIIAGCAGSAGRYDYNKTAVPDQDEGLIAANEEPAAPEVCGQLPVEKTKRDRFGIKSAEQAMYADTLSATTMPENYNTEEYDLITENSFKSPLHDPLSTFSIDVDTASYSNIRRFLDYGQKPSPDAVRIEEMINYFKYSYPKPEGSDPFSINLELSDCLWNSKAKLLMVGLQGKSLDFDHLNPSNLVFLIDSSGSMSDSNKLPLLKKALGLLLDGLSDKDSVAIVAYAGSSGLVLDTTPASDKKKIMNAIDRLSAGGSTAGAAGIELAYKVAVENYISGGNNRVILCTDGDFNVGVSSSSDLVRMIEEKRKNDVYLTICGFGMGNYKDGRMEQISNAGNGNYFYIDSMREAEKVFVHDMRANMFTIAKDVKIQIEFNPAVVKAYRLVGYENRVMAAEDFNDDKKDAGELGPGHSVTALYEIIPAGSDFEVADIDELKYQAGTETDTNFGAEMLTVKFRYKPIDSDTSILIEKTCEYNPRGLEQASENLRFASAVAGFGMLLRDSEFKGSLDYDTLIAFAGKTRGQDENGYRNELFQLIKTASRLD
ncbi:MAG: von Willebrand factor type A domain-containing protein [Spirochaetales bacterium]|nr:von Willebrand factor type A domain-containing protein [Spirochaetales bacterium]